MTLAAPLPGDANQLPGDLAWKKWFEASWLILGEKGQKA